VPGRHRAAHGQSVRSVDGALCLELDHGGAAAYRRERAAAAHARLQRGGQRARLAYRRIVGTGGRRRCGGGYAGDDGDLHRVAPRGVCPSASERGCMTERIAVVGAGQMGNGIAHVAAAAGFPVTMIDVSNDALAKGRATIEKNLARQVQKGTLDETARSAALDRIATAGALDAARDAVLIVEAATENTELKFRIFEQLDQLARPDAILASNTSSISITEIAARTKRPAQVIGMHL